MRLSQKDLRKIIRKNIRNNILKEAPGAPQTLGTVPTPAPALELDVEATEAWRAELAGQADLFAEGVAQGVGLSPGMTRQVAKEIADVLWEATEGAGDGMISGAIDYATGGLIGGIGTNEKAVQKAFSDSRIKCLADLSYISWFYEKRRPGYDLANTLAGEYGYFTSDDFMKNVRDPLEDLLMDKPILFLGNEGFDAARLAQIQTQAAAFISDSQDFVGRDATERVLDSGKGVAAASATLGMLGAAGVVSAEIGLFGVSAGGILTALGSGFVGGATGGLVGTSGAALGASTFAASIPVIGGALGSIPGPGWVALGVLAIGAGLFYAFDEADFTLQEESMLSPDLYNQLDDIIREQSNVLRAESTTAEIFFEPEEVVPPAVVYAALPPDTNGLSNDETECTRRIQVIMNAYNTSRVLRANSIPENGNWDSITQTMWTNTFIKHVFQAPSKFSEISIAPNIASGQVSNWLSISNSLIGAYPGYTGDKRGCLAFCLDAYYDNIYYGSLAAGEVDRAQTSLNTGADNDNTYPRRGSGAASYARQDVETNADYGNVDVSTGSLGAGDILVSVQFDVSAINANITDDTKSTSYKNASRLKQILPSLNKKLTDRLVTNMKEFDVLSGRSGKMVDTETTFELKLRVRRGKIKVKRDNTVRKISGNRPGRNFGKLAKTVEQTLNNDESVILNAFDGLKMQITLPRGKYVSSLDENKRLRKLVRTAILRKILL